MRYTLFVLTTFLLFSCKREEISCPPHKVVIMQPYPRMQTNITGQPIDIPIVQYVEYSCESPNNKGIGSSITQLKIDFLGGGDYQNVLNTRIQIEPIAYGDTIKCYYSFSFNESGVYRICLSPDIDNVILEEDENNTLCL